MNNLIEKLRARWLAHYRGSTLEQLLRWWGGELHELAPTQLRDWFDHQPEYLLVVVTEQEWVLYRAGGDRPAELERLRPSLEETEVTRERLQRLTAAFEEDEYRCVFSLPRERALVKRLTLPAAAEENLRQVLAFEMDRQTPFKAQQVYFDYRVLKRDAAHRTLDLQLVVTPKPALDEVLQELAARGFMLDAVDVAADNARPPSRLGVNLLPRAARAKRSQTQTRLNVGLAAAAVVLLVLVMWQSLALKDARIRELEARVQAARGSAMEVAAQRKELEQAVEAANFLVQRKREQPVVINVLREATEILPDHTWLQRLQLEAKEVQLLGETPSASEIIGVIDDSPLLAEASFISPVTANTNSGKERFHIEATVLSLKSTVVEPAPGNPDQQAAPAARQAAGQGAGAQPPGPGAGNPSTPAAWQPPDQAASEVPGNASTAARS